MSFLFFIVAVFAGAINSVAGGGSFLTLPTLLYAGVSPVVANATSALAMLPGSVASTVAYRRELQGRTRWLVPLTIVSLIGGFMGAVLLVRTSDTSFMRLLLWLMLLAAVTFTFGDRVRRALSLERLHGNVLLVGILQFVIAAYGGYFGAVLARKIDPRWVRAFVIAVGWTMTAHFFLT